MKVIPVVTPDEMRRIDTRAIDMFGIPGIVLMENAALGMLRVLKEVYAPKHLDQILILAGTGNNGGDGFALARHLYVEGYRVITWVINPDQKEIKGDAAVNLSILHKLSAQVKTITSLEDLQEALPVLLSSAYIVDAIFGTGLTRPLEGVYRALVQKVNESGISVLAVDIPSGIHGETGHVLGYALKAAHTVTFGYKKRGHLFYPGRSFAGHVHTALIGLPGDSSKALNVSAFTLRDKEAAHLLKIRPADGHKGTFGRVAVLAGSTGLTGAAYLTAQSASKSGAGLITLGIPASLQSILAVKLTEVMTVALPDRGQGHLTTDSLPQVLDILGKKDVLAIGPGLGKYSEVFEIIRHIFGKIHISIVVDADGLNHISEDMTLLNQHTQPLILTPHPAEMARLTGLPLQEILKDPATAALEFARKYQCVLLLKGATSVVADPKGRLYINASGNSGMAAGGSGDCLTGIIAAMIAQGLEAFDAAVLGCYVHGRAGDLAAQRMGEAGMTAVDLLEAIPHTLAGLYALRHLDGKLTNNCIEDFKDFC